MTATRRTLRSRWALVVAGVVLVSVIAVAWWPRTQVVDQAETWDGPEPPPNVEPWRPGEVLLVRSWRLFGLSEQYRLWAGYKVEQGGSVLGIPVLCGRIHDIDVAEAGDPPALANLRWTGQDYEVGFVSGQTFHLGADVMTPCR